MNKYFYDGLLCGLYNQHDDNPYPFNSFEFWQWEHGFSQGMTEFMNSLQSKINNLMKG